jgi:hypothetical protein
MLLVGSLGGALLPICLCWPLFFYGLASFGNFPFF